jgi:hypothetical protein
VPFVKLHSKSHRLMLNEILCVFFNSPLLFLFSFRIRCCVSFFFFISSYFDANLFDSVLKIDHTNGAKKSVCCCSMKLCAANPFEQWMFFTHFQTQIFAKDFFAIISGFLISRLEFIVALFLTTTTESASGFTHSDMKRALKGGTESSARGN